MARNRRSQSAAVRFAPALTALLFCIFIGGAGVGYVWYKSQIDLLGKQIKEREVRLVELQRQNKMARAQLAELCSPINLEARVKSLNLGLVAPPVSQIVRIVETPFDVADVEFENDQKETRHALADVRDRSN